MQQVEIYGYNTSLKMKTVGDKSKKRLLFEAMDLLGEIPTLNLNKNSNFKTIFGGMVTVLFYILCILSMVYYGIFVFKKDPTQVEYNSYYTHDYPAYDLWKEDFLLAIQMIQGDVYLTGDMLRANFNVTLQYQKITRSVDYSSGKINEEVEIYYHHPMPCTGGSKASLYSKFIGNEEDSKKILIDNFNCFYPIDSDPQSFNKFKISSSPDRGVHEKLVLNIGKCNPAIDTLCKGPLDTILNTVYLNMPVVGIDSSNSNNPITYSSDASHRLEMLPAVTTLNTFFVKQTEVYDFREEFIGGDIFVQSKVSIESKRLAWEQMASATSPYFQFTFLSGNQKEIVTRTYFGILDWLASIGGLMEILSIGCAALYYFYGEYFYSRYILKEVYTKDIETFLQEIKKRSTKQVNEIPDNASVSLKDQAPNSRVESLLSNFEKILSRKDIAKKLGNRVSSKAEFSSFLNEIGQIKNLQDKLLSADKQSVLKEVIANSDSRDPQQTHMTIEDALVLLYTDQPDNEFHRELNKLLIEMIEPKDLSKAPGFGESVSLVK